MYSNEMGQDIVMKSLASYQSMKKHAVVFVTKVFFQITDTAWPLIWSSDSAITETNKQRYIDNKIQNME